MWLSLTLNFSLTSTFNSNKFYWITFKPTEGILLPSSLHLNMDLMLSLLPGFQTEYTENLFTNIKSNKKLSNMYCENKVGPTKYILNQTASCFFFKHENK